MNSTKALKNILLTLFLLGFFGLQVIHYGFFNYLYLLFVLIFAYPALRSKTYYTKPILIYVFLVFLSCWYSWRFNGQALHKVIGHSYVYFALIFFFHLINKKLTYKEAERILFVVAMCFCFAYILQWLVTPTVLFSGAADENKNDLSSGYYRVRLTGSISCYFMLLYSVNKYLLTRKVKYIAFAFLGFVPIIIQGFRSLTGLSALSVFLMIPFVLRSGFKTVVYSVLGMVVVGLLTTTSLVQSKMEEMMRRQDSNQTFDNSDYIRFLSFDYYWNQQFTKPYEKVFGGGQPIDGNSKYKREVDSAIEYFHFYWVDLGIIGLSMVIGIPAVLLLVFIYCMCMWKCKEPPLQYIRFTLFVVLVGSIFTSMELYRGGNILLLSLFLYLEYKYHKEIKSVDDKPEKVRRMLRLHGLPKHLLT